MSKETIPEEPIYYTYALIDPRKPSKENYIGGLSLYDYEVFYFGYTGKEKRLEQHLACYKSDKNINKKNIIKEIQEAGLEVKFVKIIDNVDKYTAIKKEIEMIAYYGREDLGLGPLTNRTNGGDGGNSGNCKARTKEHSKKISEARLQSNLLWYNNGSEAKYFAENEQPDGWVSGRLPMEEDIKKKISEKCKGENHPHFGMKIYNNGKKEGRFFKGQEPKNWIEGRLTNYKNMDCITINNITKSLKEWANISGTKYPTIHARIKYYGWSSKEAVFGK